MQQSAKNTKLSQRVTSRSKSPKTAKKLFSNQNNSLPIKCEGAQILTSDNFISKIGKIGLQVVDTVESMQRKMLQVQSPKFGRRGSRTFSFTYPQYNAPSQIDHHNFEKPKTTFSHRTVQKMLNQLQQVKSLYISIKISHSKLTEKTFQDIKNIKANFNTICQQNNILIQQNKKLKRKIDLHERVSQRQSIKAERSNMSKIVEQIEGFKDVIKSQLNKINEREGQIKTLKLQLQSNRKYIKEIMLQSRKKSQLILELQSQLKDKILIECRKRSQSNYNILEKPSLVCLKSQLKAETSNNLNASIDDEENQKPSQEFFKKFAQRNSVQPTRTNKRQSILCETQSAINSFPFNRTWTNVQNIPLSCNNVINNKKANQQTTDIGNRLDKLIVNISQQITTLKKQTKRI